MLLYMDGDVLDIAYLYYLYIYTEKKNTIFDDVLTEKTNIYVYIQYILIYMYESLYMYLGMNQVIPHRKQK